MPKAKPLTIGTRAALILGAFGAASLAAAATPQAAASYTLSVFAAAPSGLSAPDSVVVFEDHVFVGYGDGHQPDGSDGLDSQVVEYKMDGTWVHTFTVHGHNDGLKVDPYTNELWALQNEDANPNLVIIDPRSGRQREYLFGPTPHGGGYDDMVFRGCKTYLSASNPANNPNMEPAIVSAWIDGSMVNVAPLLMANASAIDLPTGQSVTLNLQDPDSMTLNPLGDIVLDSQADQMLIIVTHPGTKKQQALRLPLSYLSPSGQTAVETDDTAFATSAQGYILFADKGLNEVFKVSRAAFSPGQAYTAADGGPFVGALDVTSGIVTPVVTGLSGPGGMQFVDTSVHPDGDRHDWRDEQCGRDQDE
ncbi:MAG TPA: hypothetical protein VGT07_07620 [Steroidobacteraceae bacterium]|nr:hypothetical protein [Steroidobacteraceae bacterium]